MEALKKRRATHKGNLTRLKNTVDLLDENTVSSLQVECRLERLQDIAQDLKDNHIEIVDASADQTEADLHQADFEASETRFEELKDKLLVLMDKAKSRENPAPQQQQQQPPIQQPQIQFQQTSLKKLDLPKFSGQYKDWPTFQDMFKAMVHDKQIYREHEKLWYLKQALEESVPEILNSTSITDANYAGAWQQVQDRFAHPRLLLTAQIHELLDLPYVRGESAKELRSLLDITASVLRAVHAMAVVTDEWDPILVCVVVKRIDSETRRLWEQSLTTKDMPKFEDLRKFLTRRCEGLEALGTCEKRIKSVGERRRPGDRRSPMSEEVSTAADLFASQVRVTKRSECCIFCGNNHESKDCRKASRMTYAERKKIVDDRRACYLCLRGAHGVKNCRDKGTCQLCHKRHHVLVCGQTSEKIEGRPTPENEGQQSSGVITMSSFSFNSQVYLKTVLVRLQSNGKEKVVRAMIDTGAQRSYILKKTAATSKCLKIGEETIEHELFGGVKTIPKTHSVFLVQLSSMDRTFACRIQMRDEDKVCDALPGPSATIVKEALAKNNITLSDCGEGPREIVILIGGDVAGKLMLGCHRPIQLPSGPVAIHTKFGWTVLGRDDSIPRNNSVAMTVTSMMVKEHSIQNLWNLDVLGIQDPLSVKSKLELQQAAKNHFMETVARDEEGRYQVRLPWIEDHPLLPSNKAMAVKRMENEVKKQKLSGDFQAYSQVLKEWESEGIIEVVPPEDACSIEHYLPHRAVKKEGSLTTKIRPVFDASAHSKGQPSLNMCLEKGPNLIEIIPSVMMRFRQERIGVVSDIKKAFLQLSVHPRDRDFLKFMWPNDDGQVQVYRHKRVVFGVTFSPFLLGAVIEHHLENARSEFEKTAQKLKTSFYVDNCVTSVPDFTAYEKLKEEASNLMEEGQMELRGWEHSGQMEEPTVSAVLGMRWNKVDDTLCVDLSWISKLQDGGSEAITKRKILSTSHHLYDPIGIASPVTLVPKVMLQETWESKLGWDEQVPEEMEKKFRKWLEQLTSLEEMKIPRWFLKGVVDKKDMSIHVFVDASKDAYAACIFIRADGEDVSVQLLMSKSRVSPKELKGSIHRLELMACCIGARLLKSIQGMMNIEEIPIYCWSDSSTALTWIKKAEQWSVFVRNRVQEIRELTNADVWSHVPGILNPADLPSRGCSAKSLVDSRWWEGPPWLMEAKDKWPSGDYSPEEEEVDKERLKLVKSFLVLSPDHTRSHRLTTFTHRYDRIVRVIGMILGWREKVRGMPVAASSEPGSHSGSQADEVVESATVAPEPVSHSGSQAGVRISHRRAEEALLKLVQAESFCGEDDPQLGSIVVEEDDGLLKVKTKLTYREDSSNFKRPIVLPEVHPIVRLIIMTKHRELCHAGVPTVLRALREDFWILHGRRAVKKILKDCVLCKRFSAKKFVTTAAALPEKRVRDADCFEIVGVDLAGPLYLRPFPAQDGKESKSNKAWIVLFTCAVYRAVHLELVSSLSTERFLEAFRRFVSRRGRPAVVYSDNGTNFVGANNLFKMVNWEKVQGYQKLKKIEWIFNPPTAAWWGGWWERLVGLMKNLLRRTLGKAHLNFEEMTTMLCEAEAVLNSRPLTYITEDSEDLIPLTPAMFLRDTRDDQLPEVEEIDGDLLTRRWMYQQKLKKDLRDRFRSEYLGQLVQKRSSEKVTREIKVGEQVYVGQDNRKRQQWPVGKVIEIYPGRDGVKRTVRVKTENGELVRPVQRLYPMELVPDQVQELVEKAEVLKEPKKTVKPKEKTQDTPEKPKELVPVSSSGRAIKKPKRWTCDVF